MSNQAMSRRRFIKTVGATGLGLVAGGALSACAPPAPQIQQVEVTRVTEKAIAPTPWTLVKPDKPLEFYAWDFQPNQIENNIQIFTEQSGIPVNTHIIPNVGYNSGLQTKIMGGIHMDAFYNFRYNTSKFYNASWARRLDDLPDADKIKSEMFANAVPLYTAADGALICLPYFNAVHVTHYNKAFLEKAGFSGPPKSKQDMYDQCKKLKADGIAPAPYSAYWIKEFCEEYLMVYLLSDGIKPFDANYDPVFKDDPATIAAFEWWQAMFQDGLTAETMLTDQPPQLLTSVQEGNAAFFTLHHYFLKSIRDAKATQSENIVLSDWMPGKTGETFLMGEVIQMAAEPSSLSAAWELMKFYGWKDKDGVLRTFKEWAKAAALACPYPAFFQDPEVRAAYGTYYDFDMLLDLFQNRSDPVQARNAVWYPEFQTFVGDAIQQMLKGEKTPTETAAALADKVVALKKEISG